MPQCKYSWEAKKRTRCSLTAAYPEGKATGETINNEVPMAYQYSPSTPNSTDNDDLQGVEIQDLTKPYPPGFEEATIFPQPLEGDGLPDSGGFYSPSTGTPGMQDALTFPTPLRSPSN